MSKQPFNLEQFLRQSEATTFTLEVTHVDEVSIEITITNPSNQSEQFRCYIERSAILPKLATDKMREMFSNLKGQSGKFNSKNLYKGSKAKLDKHRD